VGDDGDDGDDGGDGGNETCEKVELGGEAWLVAAEDVAELHLWAIVCEQAWERWLMVPVGMRMISHEFLGCGPH